MTASESTPSRRVGTGRRLLARLIDLVLVGVVFLGIFVVALISLLAGLDCAGSWVVACGVSALAAVLALALLIAALLFPLAYEAVCVHFWGRTLGKKLLGISVVRRDGGRATLSDSLQRASVIWLPGTLASLPWFIDTDSDTLFAIALLLGVGYAIGLFVVVLLGRSPQDSLAGTMLISGAPPEPATDGTAPPVRALVIAGGAFAALLLVLLVLRPFGEGDSGKVEVLTTSALLADMVRNVAGDHAEVSYAFTRPGEGHSVDPTRSQRNAVRDADFVVAFGDYDADFNIRTGAEAYIVERSRTNPSLRIDDIKSAYERRYPDRILFERRDLHTWLSTSNALIMVAIIRDALIAEDPENADAYQANADAYMTEIAELDDEIRAQIATVPERCRMLFTDREFLTYYAADYGFTTMGPVVSPFGNQPEAQADRDEMVALIRRSPVKKIFVHEGAADDVQAVARPAVSDVVELHADELGGPGSGAETYFELMRTNTQRIVDALQVC